MVKEKLIEELDQAIEVIIRNQGDPLPEVDARIAPLIRIAAELRDLPTAEFRTRLASELVSRVATSQSTPAESSAGHTEVAGIVEAGGQISAGQDDRASATELVPLDVRAALEGLPEMTMRFIGKL